MNRRTPTSPTGWWIAELIEKQSDPARAPYWVNHILIKAEDWRTAFRRATEMGLRDVAVGNKAFGHQQEFLGLADLVPIYEQFEDGAELMWKELWPEDKSPDLPQIEVYTESDLEALYHDSSDQTKVGDPA